jgi:hypothetical protein
MATFPLSIHAAPPSGFFQPERSVIDIVHSSDMKVLGNGAKVFVVVQEAAVEYFCRRGDDDVQRRDSYALAS